MTPPGRILVVEDQYFVAMDCELNLQAAGYECVGLAKAADEAVELAGELHPDLILMDIRLANGSDGVDAATRIYDRFGIRSIFASGHADAVTRREAECAQPLGWLDKPYTAAVMINVVTAALQEVLAKRSEAAEPATLCDAVLPLAKVVAS